jgi:hypothetical protein
MPGAGRPHGPPAEKKQAAVTTGSAETSGIPRAMVLRLIRDLPGAPGLLATITCATREHQRKFDTSVGVSEQHDFAVRIVLFVRARTPTLQPDAPTAPRAQRP